jgi:hypothetical protein
MNFDRTSTALRMRSVGMVVLFLFCAAVIAQPANEPNISCSGLHAGIAVQVVARKPPNTQPSFVMVSFVLLNDGGSPANSSPGSWTLVLDGKELDDSGMIFGNGPMPAGGYGTLGPGESYSFGKGLDLSRYFPKPGDYSMGWKGKEFQSPTIRVTVVKSDY